MIVDASVAVKWFFPEEGSDHARELVGRSILQAPPLFLIEVGNALWKKARRGELLTFEDAVARYAELGAIVQIVEDDAAEVAGRALELALALDHPIYDCTYLALAELSQNILVTADTAFCRKVQATSLAHLVRPL